MRPRHPGRLRRLREPGGQPLIDFRISDADFATAGEVLAVMHSHPSAHGGGRSSPNRSMRRVLRPDRTAGDWRSLKLSASPAAPAPGRRPRNRTRSSSATSSPPPWSVDRSAGRDGLHRPSARLAPGARHHLRSSRVEGWEASADLFRDNAPPDSTRPAEGLFVTATAS